MGTYSYISGNPSQGTRTFDGTRNTNFILTNEPFAIQTVNNNMKNSYFNLLDYTVSIYSGDSASNYELTQWSIWINGVGEQNYPMIKYLGKKDKRVTFIFNPPAGSGKSSHTVSLYVLNFTKTDLDIDKYSPVVYRVFNTFPLKINKGDLTIDTDIGRITAYDSRLYKYEERINNVGAVITTPSDNIINIDTPYGFSNKSLVLSLTADVGKTYGKRGLPLLCFLSGIISSVSVSPNGTNIRFFMYFYIMYKNNNYRIENNKKSLFSILYLFLF